MTAVVTLLNLVVGSLAGLVLLTGDWAGTTNTLLLIILALVNSWQAKQIASIQHKVHETRPYRRTDPPTGEHSERRSQP